MDIKYIMNTGYPYCIAATNINDVVLMLTKSSHDAIVVLNQNMLPIGIITEQDIYEIYSRSDCRSPEFIASDVIKNKQICICWEGDDAQIALSMINDRNLSFLPVVNNEFCFVGVMAVCDAVISYENVVPFIRDVKFINNSLF